MIVDQLVNLKKYASLSQHLPMVVTFLKNHPLKDLAMGNTIVNESVFIVKAKVENLDKLETLYEIHHKHIDIHICLCGEEKISYLSKDDFNSDTIYDKSEDCQLGFTKKEIASVHYSPMHFAMFMPNEWHQPKQFAGSESIVKVVIKIRTEE